MVPVDRRRSALLVVLVTGLVLMLARPAAAAAPTNDPRSDEQWGLLDTKAPQAWAKGRGAGVSIAVVSTGIAKHEDLTAKLDAGFSGVGGDAASDASGRGTHLAGIAAATTDNSIGIAGVAPDARLLPYKAFEGETTDGNGHIQALNKASSAKPAVVLVDVPSGYPASKRDLLRQALKALGDSGISVVVGAQDGLSLDELPVLAVAATTSSGGQAPGTAGVGGRGVAAPGGGILSTDKASLLPTAPPAYEERSGTGQAAAHAAGAVAILRGIGASSGQAADLLRSTARKSSGSFGAGIIDVAAAAAAYKAAPPPPPAAATTTTTKAVAKPVAGAKPKGPAATLVPPGAVASADPAGPTLATGEPAELGDGQEEAVVPPGAEEFANGPESPGAGLVVGGRERPWGTLAVGFGALFGVGTALSITFRRLADAPI